MKRIITHPFGLRFKNLTVVVLISLLAFSGANAFSQTTRYAGTEAEFDDAYNKSSSIANDIIYFNNNIVVTGEKILSKTITINGNGHSISVPNPGLDDLGRFNASASSFRVFTISATYQALITNLTIKGGSVSDEGGALSVAGVLWMNYCNVSNSRGGSGGGGIVNTGLAFISNSIINRNAAGHGGGFVNSGTMYIERSTFSENRSTYSAGGGGAGENQGTGILYINNSTISNNQSTEIGGGINNYKGTIYIANSSVTGNVAYGAASFTGGGIGNNGGKVYALNSLFAYNYHITAGDVTNPTVYELDDVTTYGASGGTANLYYCIYHDVLQTGTVNLIGSIKYSGLADGSDNSIFSGGSLSKITDGTGTEIGTATLYRPFLYKSNGYTAPTLNSSSVILLTGNKGTQTRYANNNNISPAMAYFNKTTGWINLIGTSTTAQLVATDQMGASRANPPVVGAVETATSSALYMLKVNLTPGGSVNGGTLYGDVYLSGSSITVSAIPNTGYQFLRWDYVGGIGGTGTASSLNPYTLTVNRNITIIPVFGKKAVSGDWNATATWALNAVPTSLDEVLIPAGVTLTIGSANAICKALTINPGGELTLNAGKTLTATTFTINSDVTGTGTFVNNGTSNITSANVNQYLSYRTWYLSSPVSNATISDMNKIKYYNEPTNVWSASGTQMVMGKGYLTVPNNGVSNIAFNGTLNDGNLLIPLTRSAGNTIKPGFNLIGNPYPSYLDWTAIYAGNSVIMPTSTMWYRTKVSGAYAFWTVNGALGVGTPTEASRYIPPMQAFWVRTNNGGGSLLLNNAMRMHAPATNYLLKAPAVKYTENQLLRLQVNNGTNTDEAVIYFNTNASDGFDAYDSPKMSNEDTNIPEIYTMNGEEHLVINGMKSIPLNQNIGLGFVPGSAASFSIRANEVSNLPSNLKVILKDNVTGTETDLTDGVAAYEFSQAEISTERFSVIFRTAGTVTGVNTEKDQEITVYCNSEKKITVVCNSSLNNSTTVSVYNAIGQLLVGRKLTAITTVLDSSFFPGVYVVKVNNSICKVIVK